MNDFYHNSFLLPFSSQNKIHDAGVMICGLIVCLSLLLVQAEPAKAQSNADSNDPTSRTLTLAGYKLTPSVTTSGSGSVTLTVRNDSLIVKGSFSDLSSQFVSSGIYYALENRAFNQIFRFKTELNDQWTGGKIPAGNNRFALSDALKEMLKNGELSVRIMTNENKQGEIGAQIPESL